MLFSEFERVIKDNYKLSLSDILDLVSFISDLPYDVVKNSRGANLTLADEKCAQVFEKLDKKTPVAYISKRREFFSREFFINESVLIPRVETELLVSCAADFIKQSGQKNLRLLDLCSGSGCILLSILLEASDFIKEAKYVDISPKAMEVAEENARRFGLSDKIEFIISDAASFFEQEPFDIVTCNPPYIAKADFEGLEAEVKHEPYIALVSPFDELHFYKKILGGFDLLCKKNGALFFEIGYNQKLRLEKLAKDFSIKCSFEKDLAGLDRVFICYK